ncbi:MAG TPA: glycoside hydrolase domain-containing protein [Solirubrobacteraceae bacterium]|nr:glycoside hydrolase domain-containing protein [Solirubrobacteraceae bacterium]
MPGSIAHAVARPRAVCAGVLAILCACLAAAPALASSSLKVVSYHGYRVKVPRSWPVYNLARDPGVCVRFDRHAVYLGTPSAAQRCPAHAAGRTEAILLQPTAVRASAADAVTAAAASGGAGLTSAPGGDAGSLLDRLHGVLVTATWRADGGEIRQALGLHSLGVLKAPRTSPGGGRSLFEARIASASPATPGGVYTGSGFDACSTPSTAHMSAWGSSPYRAIGVYIGGANAACAQPNLSAGWVSQESAAGWHLIPIYVGLQAPSNSCGCASISSSSASTQGAAAAADAATKAQALGLGAGNPIYFDMEAYSPGGSNTPAVLAFLSAWTLQLHARGYESGVYSSDDSGISDLVSQYGTGYEEPDEIWIANWNGAKTTSDANVPSTEWAAHQRLHQYSGAHNETYGGVTINIDGDYLDAATAAAGTVAGTASEWAASSPPTVTGQAIEGQTLTEGHGVWSGAPTGFTYQWEDCNSTGGACVWIPGATGQTYTLEPADVGHTVRVQEIAASGAATSVASFSRPTAVVLSTTPLYWLYTAYGNVNQSLGTAWYGSPIGNHYRGKSVVGMAATRDGKGYWVATSTGGVYAYGDAKRLRPPRARAVKGIVAAPGGGYWLYTAYGNVYRSADAAWYGSPIGSHYRGSSIVGMTATPDGRGYRLVTSTGTVYSYGDATREQAPRARGVVGIVAAPTGGYWLYTSAGNVDPTAGTPWYGSPAASHYRGRWVVGMAPTSDGKGYWVVTSAGNVYCLGDANRLPGPSHTHPIVGMAG